MKKLMIVLAAAVMFQGCGGLELYPDSDVVEPPDFELKVATGVHKSGGILLGGTLEYAGSGDLVQAYREYVTAMRIHGWTGAADDIQGQKAVGTLRKDNRTCALEFTSAEGQVKISIKVSQTK